ncbi:phytoene synthase, partial [Streptomyces erythrochromogenes]
GGGATPRGGGPPTALVSGKLAAARITGGARRTSGRTEGAAR